VVGANGSRRLLWRYVSPRTGKPNEAGLGGYPQTPLATAKDMVIEWRELVCKGVDPVADRRATKLAVKVEGKTLRDVLTMYAEEFKTEAGAREAKRLIERHAVPLLAKNADALIAPVEIKAALANVISTYPRTAARTRAALSSLFEYAMAHDLRSDDPAAKARMRKLMPKPPKSEPYRMPPLKLMPDYWRRLVDYGAVSSLALAFTIATAARQAETTGMTHDDLDLEQRMWIVPARKMKKGREHRQPLNDAALDVLTRVKSLGRKSSYVFPGLGGSRMGSRTMERVQHRIMQFPYSAHATARATFSTFAHEMTDHPHELIELSLAHVEGRGNSVAGLQQIRCAGAPPSVDGGLGEIPRGVTCGGKIMGSHRPRSYPGCAAAIRAAPRRSDGIAGDYPAARP
jgi:integrase